MTFNLPKTFDDFQEILVQAIQLSMAGSRAILVYYLPGMEWTGGDCQTVKAISTQAKKKALVKALS